MADMVRVAVDAMGGDNAPVETVKGAVEAVNADKKVKVFLVGIQDVVEEELKKYTYDPSQIEVVHASEVIETAEADIGFSFLKRGGGSRRPPSSGRTPRAMRSIACWTSDAPRV